MKKLSLIISVYNEEAVLEKFYKAFCSIEQNLEYGGGGYELIFVNDGSTDASMNILEVIAQQNKNVRVISFSRNFGHEAAMIAGIDHAAGDVIICMDADLQHPLECIAPIMAKFEEGYEVISMVRTSNKSAGAIKNFTSRAFYRVINALSDQVKLEENASDFFAISSRVADVLRTNYREKTRFLRGYVQSVGFRKTTLEYTAAERAGGASHYTLKKLMNFAISTIVGFSDFPLKLGLYAGAVSFLAAVIFAISALCGFREYKVILAAVNVLFAVLFLLVGIMGEYFSVAFAELKNRPINYVIVGGLTTVVSLTSYYFFTTAFLDPQDPFQLMAANTFSWICAVSFAYITNRKFVFESKSTDKLREMLKFFSARISTLLIEMACMTLLVNILHWNDRISKFAVQFIVMALNYIFSKLFVFRIKE